MSPAVRPDPWLFSAPLLGATLLISSTTVAQPAPPVRKPAASEPADADATRTEDDRPAKLEVSSPTDIEAKPLPPHAKVSFNLQDADLPELVKAISNITGKRFVFGGKLRNITATVHAPQEITVGEAYQAFLSILETNGMTVVPNGRMYTIVETTNVEQQALPVVGLDEGTPAEDRFVTRLYRPKHIAASEVATTLSSMVSKGAKMIPVASGNLLIITDTGRNIRRLLQIVDVLDVEASSASLYVQRLYHRDPEELAEQLGSMLGLNGPDAPPISLTPDVATQSLVIYGSAEDYERVLELLRALDVSPEGGGKLRVIRLQHAGCDELEPTLEELVGSVPAAPGRPASSGDDDARITCDPIANKLLVRASNEVVMELRTILEEVDVPRRQVFIEAIIMDVGTDDLNDFGLGAHFGNGINGGNDGLYYGGSNAAPSIAGVPTNVEALALGIRGPEISGSDGIFGTGVSIPAFGVVMHALQQNTRTNILATPHVIATDNVQAEISIGENIPLQTNTAPTLASLAGATDAATSSLLSNATGSVPRTDVGTKITVTPHVNDSNQVRLEISQEISNEGVRTGDLDVVSINKRTAVTTLVAEDQQTVVIGGLMREAINSVESKTPILGDIPLLGMLFRQERTIATKRNLLLVLTPYIVRSQADLRAVFLRKMQERQEFLDRQYVFRDGIDWEPPIDFRRKNGLVEAVRQELILVERQRELEEDVRGTDQTHEPAIPIKPPHRPVSGATQSTSAPSPPVTTPASIQRPAAAPSRPGLRRTE